MCQYAAKPFQSTDRVPTKTQGRGYFRKHVTGTENFMKLIANPIHILTVTDHARILFTRHILHTYTERKQTATLLSPEQAAVNEYTRNRPKEGRTVV